MKVRTICLVALSMVVAVTSEDGWNPTQQTGFFGNQTDSAAEAPGSEPDGRTREGRNFLDFLGLGTGPETDPYLAKANSLCLNGDFAECFKSRALSSLGDFFSKEGYYLNENVRVMRMPGSELRRLTEEPYEFSSSPRSDEPEWDQFVKFLLRKVEHFVKSTALEVRVPEEITEEGRYSPRFVDEIASELDAIEDKKASIFTRNKLKKLFIPLLIILKLFKLKLLLFLPMILGLASFKKLLGFLAIVLPGLIGVFHLCKPQLGSSSFGGGHNNYYQPQYSSAGVAHGPYFGHSSGYREEYPDYTSYNSNLETGKSLKSQKTGGVAFRDDQKTDASELAYGFHKK